MPNIIINIPLYLLYGRLTTRFKLKQLVRKATRGDQILDLVLTNLPQLYDKDAVQILPPFGLYDHNVVVINPKERALRDGPSRKIIARRDSRASRKNELGRYLLFDRLVACGLGR